MRIKSILFVTSLTLVLAIDLLHETSAQAQSVAPKLRSFEVSWDFKPPNRDAPQTTAGGASRNGSCVSTAPPLTLLIPETKIGLTTLARPTFLVYLPNTTAKSAEFVLRDINDKDVYRTLIQLPATPGIFRFSLPEQAPGLEVDKDYRWFFSMICRPNDRLEDVFASGWVQRVQPTRKLATALFLNPPSREQVALYAESSYWYDSLALLAELRQKQPNDAELKANWLRMLKSVGLAEVADQPLLNPPAKPTQPVRRRSSGSGR
jgi:hypothetical protein